MEFSEILPSIINAIPTIVVAVCAFIFGRYNSKSDKTSSILEEQYLKVISPMHRALKYIKKEDSIEVIDKIVVENYHLLPDGLYEDYRKYRDNKKGYKPFENRINEFNRILRYKLGYSKIKIKKQDREAEKQLASVSKFVIENIFSYVFFMCSMIMLLLLSLSKIGVLKELERTEELYLITLTVECAVLPIVLKNIKKKL